MLIPHPIKAAATPYKTNTQRIMHLAMRLPAAAQLTSEGTTVALGMPPTRLASSSSARTPASRAPAQAPARSGLWAADAPSDGASPAGTNLLGLGREQLLRARGVHAGLGDE